MIRFRLLRIAAMAVLVHAASTIVALVGSDGVRGAIALLFLVLFLTGCVLFLWGFLIAVGRSRTEDVPMAGVFFLAGGSVGSSDRGWLMAAIGLHVTIGLAGAAAAPFTPLAFGILVPMFGVGIVALYGAKLGKFGPRPATE